MSKVVKYRDYFFELRKLQRKYRLDGNIYVCDTHNFGVDEEPIQLGVNWASIGTVSVEEAEKFISTLKQAIEDCKNFKYNGYIIDYSK